MKSKLLLPTYDGNLTEWKVYPQCKDTRADFQIQYYRRTGKETHSVCAVLRFYHVASVDFEVNFFDNPIGAELGGFYEIFDTDTKKQMLEKVFQHRKAGYLIHGDYHYAPEEPADMLNFRPPMDDMQETLEQYRLYQLQTQGGIYHLLCKRYELMEN